MVPVRITSTGELGVFVNNPAVTGLRQAVTLIKFNLIKCCNLLYILDFMMIENFADLFEQSLNEIDMTPGAIVTGTVIDIDTDWVTVHAGLKSEGDIPRIQFLDEQGNLSLKIGECSK